MIWGDCNPKNVVVGSGRVRLIDFQPKRSSAMLDLVLLMTLRNTAKSRGPSGPGRCLRG